MVSRGSNLPRVWVGLAAVLVLKSSVGIGGEMYVNDRAICSARLSFNAHQQIPDTVRLKILLVEFQDVRCQKDSAGNLPRYSSRDFEDMLGSEGIYVSPLRYSPDGDPVYGSMNDYFRAMSAGAMSVRATVINPTDARTGLPVWIRLPNAKDFYEEDISKDSIFIGAEREATARALDVSTSADTKLAIIYAGNIYYKGGGLNPVTWGNRYIMSEVQGRPYSQENPDARFSRIGIHCHEFAHTIGIGHSSGSAADLMCSGTKNGSVGGNAPAPLNPIARMRMRWVNVVPVDSLPGGETDLGYSLTTPTVYKMKNSNGDYFLIENRRFDQTMTIGSSRVPDYNNAAFFPPARPHGAIKQGILVWRVNATGDVLDPEYSTEGLLYASGRFGRTYPENDPSETDDGVPFPGVSNKRILSPWSDSRNPYTKEKDYFGSSALHYTLFAPNTKGGSSWEMEILSANSGHGTFHLRFSRVNPGNAPLVAAMDPDSLGVYDNLRTTYRDSIGVTHQVLEVGGEVVYRRSTAGARGWQGLCQLSNGDGGNGLPGIAVAGSSILVVWQVQATGVGNYVFHSRRSTNAGESWSELSSPAAAYGCAESGPRPWVAADAGGRAILAYCSSSSVFCALSGNGGRSWGNSLCLSTYSKIGDGPSVSITEGSNGTAFANLAYCADSLSGGTQVHYARFDFGAGRWARSENASAILSSQYSGFSDPCLLARGLDGESSACLAWDSKDEQDPSQKIIILRDLSSGQLGGTYRVLKGRSLDDYRLAHLETGVEERKAVPAVPRQFVLEQNYPNPFNPRTVIRSQTPEASKVRIVIYDLLGREVKTLVNERRAAGDYEDSFDARGLASGVYIYRMTAGSYEQSQRMILLK